MPNPDSHYKDSNAIEYYNFQNSGGNLRGQINSRKFMPYYQKAHTLLDFGCGNGSLLAAMPADNRIGIEINPIARADAQKLGFSVFEKLSSVEDHSIDIVISNHAIEHVACPYDILLELYSKLKPNGRAIICLPIDDWRTQKKYYEGDINHHLYTWSPLLFGNLLTDVGFKVVSIDVLVHAWPPKRWEFLATHLPPIIFDMICKFTSIRYARRQIMAVAEKSNNL